MFFALIVGILSCDKEDGGGKLTFKVTITPALQKGGNTNTIAYQTLYNMFGFHVGKDVKNLDSHYLWIGYQEDQSLGSYEKELTVSKGQNITCLVQVYNQYDYVCRNVQIDALLNGTVIKKFTKNMGSKSSLNVDCKDGEEDTINLIIP